MEVAPTDGRREPGPGEVEWEALVIHLLSRRAGMSAGVLVS